MKVLVHPQSGNLFFQHTHGCIIVWLMRDFLYQLAINNVARPIYHHHCPCQQTGQRAVFHPKSITDIKILAAEHGYRNHVCYSFRYTKTTLGKRQIHRHAQHHSIIHPGRFLVKTTYRHGAYLCIQTREDIQHYALAFLTCESQISKISSYCCKIGSQSSHGRHRPRRMHGLSFEGNCFHIVKV